MGFRFRRSVKLLPGVRLNLSTRGISTSIGGRGATVNVSRRGVRSTIGIPGTGLSYSTPLRRFARASGAGVAATTTPGATMLGWIVTIVTLLLIGSCIAGLSAAPEEMAAPAATPMVSPAFLARTVAGSTVNCRAEPKTGTVLAKLDRGDQVVVQAQAGGWSRIAQAGGSCWVADALLR